MSDTTTTTTKKRGRPRKQQAGDTAHDPGSPTACLKALLDAQIHVLEVNDQVRLKKPELQEELYRQRRALEIQGSSNGQST